MLYWASYVYTILCRWQLLNSGMNRFTQIIASIRYPESTLGKTLQRCLPIFLLLLIFLVILSSLLLYYILVPARLTEQVNPGNFLMSGFETISVTSGTNTFEGWFIPSIRRAPVIFLCHGFKSNRSELLTLAATLQENGYNVFLFDMRAHGSSSVKLSTLGVTESEDLVAAINRVTERPEVDKERVGIWGVSLGAYAALSAALKSEKVKALVVDSAFDSPESFLRMQTKLISGVDSIFLRGLTYSGFYLLNRGELHSHRSLMDSLWALRGRPKLFITNEQDIDLEMQTLNLFNHSPFPKELRRMKHSGTTLLYGTERKDYEIQVWLFFKENLPIRRTTDVSVQSF
jgi:pimeloyl-ACP methyl ester carboxylesterase